MKVLILGALEKEISVLNKLLEVKEKTDYFYKKMTKNEIFTATVGVGIINALSSTYSLIDNIHPDIVINIGTAGASSLDINDGDIIICDEAIYNGGYILNNFASSQFETVEETNLIIKGNEEFSQLIDQANLNATFYHGKTLSGDFFIKNTKIINALKDKYHHICEDMETIGIYKACQEKKTPCIAYRIISNNELRGTLYSDNVLIVNEKLQTIIFDFLNYLESL